MRRILFASVALSLVAVAASFGFAQTSPSTTAQSRIVGVVTALDLPGGTLTIKTDTGESIRVITNDKSAVLRLPAGETNAQNAARISLTDIVVGDRLFARGSTAADGKSIDARQVVVTGGAVAASSTDQQRQREDFRQRGLMGRITAIDGSNKELTVQARSREGAVPVVVTVSDTTRLFRYAPDSLNIKDASRSSFADLKVGDQLRGVGNTNSDGTRFTAEELIAGSTTRTGGQVVAVNAAKNELTIKNTQGQNLTVTVGQRSSLRRVTPEMIATFEANRPQRQRGAAPGNPDAGSSGGQTRTAQEGAERRPRERREGAGGEGRRPGGGRGLQEMIESLPAITIADLKKGDTVFIQGSEGPDQSKLTAITLITGDPTFMSRFLQNGPNRGPQSPGLPGDVIGGGVGPAERPTNPQPR